MVKLMNSNRKDSHRYKLRLNRSSEKDDKQKSQLNKELTKLLENDKRERRFKRRIEMKEMEMLS